MDKAFGGARSGETIKSLAENAGRLQKKYEQIGQTSSQFGADIARTNATLRMQADETMGAITATTTKLGTDLTPPLEATMHGLRAGSHLARAQPGRARRDSRHRDHRRVGGDRLLFRVEAARSTEGAQGPQKRHLLRVQRPARTYIGGGSLATKTGTASTVGRRHHRGTPRRCRSGCGTVAAGGLGPWWCAPDRGRSSTSVGAVESETGAGISTVEEGAAGAGILTTLKAGLPKVVENGMKGGMYALVGSLGSQFLGGLVGGKAGKTISGVGTDASIGAGARDVAGPEGALIGGGGGALESGLITNLTSGPSPSQKLANSTREQAGRLSRQHSPIEEKLGDHRRRDRQAARRCRGTRSRADRAWRRTGRPRTLRPAPRPPRSSLTPPPRYRPSCSTCRTRCPGPGGGATEDFARPMGSRRYQRR